MTEITADTTLTDRDLLIHLVQHVEHIDEMMTALHDEWEVFRPLIERFRPAGGADFLTILQTGRELRRQRRSPAGPGKDTPP